VSRSKDLGENGTKNGKSRYHDAGSNEQKEKGTVSRSMDLGEKGLRVGRADIMLQVMSSRRRDQ
jgi:hypothetical protein